MLYTLYDVFLTYMRDSLPGGYLVLISTPDTLTVHCLVEFLKEATS